MERGNKGFVKQRGLSSQEKGTYLNPSCVLLVRDGPRPGTSFSEQVIHHTSPMVLPAIVPRHIFMCMICSTRRTRKRGEDRPRDTQGLSRREPLSRVREIWQRSKFAEYRPPLGNLEGGHTAKYNISSSFGPGMATSSPNPLQRNRRALYVNLPFSNR